MMHGCKYAFTGQTKITAHHVELLNFSLLSILYGFFAHAMGRMFLEDLSRKCPDVRVQNDPVRRMIRLRGCSYPRQQLRDQILSKLAELGSLGGSRSTAKKFLKGAEKRRYVTQCPVYLDEVSQPMVLPYKHAWCRTCLTEYLESAINTKSFPFDSS